jgi:catechol 2,3-dioxygenase-like lactoylglutathione lyase family enzyme
MSFDFHGACTMLQVFDVPTSLAFYCEILGFEVVGSSGPLPRCGWALLRRDDIELMLNTQYEDNRRPPAPDLARQAHHRDTCIYFGCADPDGAYIHLHEHGTNPRKPVVTHYGWKQVYVKDPDGYILCFHRPATPEEKDTAHKKGASPT